MVINSERLMLDAGHCEDEGRSRMLDTGYWMLDTECWIVDAGLWLSCPDIG